MYPYLSVQSLESKAATVLILRSNFTVTVTPTTTEGSSYLIELTTIFSIIIFLYRMKTDIQPLVTRSLEANNFSLYTTHGTGQIMYMWICMLQGVAIAKNVEKEANWPRGLGWS